VRYFLRPRAWCYHAFEAVSFSLSTADNNPHSNHPVNVPPFKTMDTTTFHFTVRRLTSPILLMTHVCALIPPPWCLRGLQFAFVTPFYFRYILIGDITARHDPHSRRIGVPLLFIYVSKCGEEPRTRHRNLFPFTESEFQFHLLRLRPRLLEKIGSFLLNGC